MKMKTNPSSLAICTPLLLPPRFMFFLAFSFFFLYDDEEGL